MLVVALLLAVALGCTDAMNLTLGDGLLPCETEAMLATTGAGIHSMWPCTVSLMPLTLFALGYAWWALCREWRRTKELVRKVSAGMLTMETIAFVGCEVPCQGSHTSACTRHRLHLPVVHCVCYRYRARWSQMLAVSSSEVA